MQRTFISPILQYEKKLQLLLDEGWEVLPHSIRIIPGVPIPNGSGVEPDTKKRTVHLYTAILSKP